MRYCQNFIKIFEVNPTPAFLFDFETLNIFKANQSALTLLGFTLEDVTSLTLKDLIFEDLDALVKQKIFNCSTDDKLSSLGNFQLIKIDGNRVKVELSVINISLEDKIAVLIFCQQINEDVLTSISSNQFLDESKSFENELHAIFKINSVGIVQADPTSGQIIFANSYYETLTGYSIDELKQMKFIEITHPDDRDNDWQIFKKALNGEIDYFNTKRYIRKDGIVIWVRLHVAFIRNENGESIRTIAICEDITSKKNEEERLKLLEDAFTKTKESILIAEAIPESATHFKLIFVNDSFNKVSALSQNKDFGKNFNLSKQLKLSDKKSSFVIESLRNNKSIKINNLKYKKNGSEYWSSISLSPVALKNGEFSHLVAIERDVTKEYLLESKKELMKSISLIFSTSDDIVSLSSELCKIIREFGNFNWVELWNPNNETNKINLIGKNGNQTIKNRDFKLDSRAESFNLGEGLPSQVWLKKNTVFWPKSTDKSKFIEVKEPILSPTFGIPFINNNEVVGVLLISSSLDRVLLEKFITIFNELIDFIGSEINRKNLENSINHLYQTTPDFLCLLNFKGKLLRVNEAGCRLIGYSQEEIRQMLFFDLIFSDDKEKSINEINKLGIGTSTVTFENRFVTKKNKLVWLSWTCNASNEEGLIYAIAKNISEEKKLSELNDISSQLAKIGSWEMDLEGNQLFWSDMVYILHETSQSEYTPELESAINLYRQDFRQLVKDTLSYSIETGGSFDFEAVLVTLKKNERWVRVIGNSEMVNGTCNRVFGSFQDIHEKKEAEIRIQSLADNLPGVVFQYNINPDRSKKLKYVSKGSQSVWGFSSDQLIEDINLLFNQIKKGGDFELVRENILKSIQSRTKFISQWRYILPTGEIKYHLGYGTPVFLSDHSIQFNMVILDITQEAKNKELLNQATEMAKIGSWELDFTNNKINSMYWSPMTKKIMGVSENYNPSLTGGLEFFADESKNKIQNAVKHLIEGGIEFDLELKVFSENRNEKWVRCIGKREWLQGNNIKIYGSFQDIQLSKSLEIQIQEILDSISDGFFAMDKNWNFIYWNQRAEYIFGQTQEMVIRKNIWELFPFFQGTSFENACHKVAKPKFPSRLNFI